MSREISGLFKEETLLREQSQLLHLISFIDIPTTPTATTINVVDSNDTATYQGVTYIKFPVMFNGVDMTSSGEINKASILVANPGRIFQDLINKYNGLRGIRVKIITVYEKFTDNGDSPDLDAYVEDEFIIDSYSSTDTVIQFSLDPVCDFNIKVPRRRYGNLCYWKYKDPDTCMYAGELATCNKDLSDCRAHANESRFGGFPGIPRQARRVNF